MSETLASQPSSFDVINFLLTLITWITGAIFVGSRFRKERRDSTYQHLFDNFFAHNWKMVEHWDNSGARPNLKEARDDLKSKKLFAKRVVTLDHFNILFQVFAQRKVIGSTEIDSFSSWAKSWFDDSQDAIEGIFERGDLYPLDFVQWLRDKIFDGGRFEGLFGTRLTARIKRYEELHGTDTYDRWIKRKLRQWGLF